MALDSCPGSSGYMSLGMPTLNATVPVKLGYMVACQNEVYPFWEVPMIRITLDSIYLYGSCHMCIRTISKGAVHKLRRPVGFCPEECARTLDGTR